MRDIKNLNIWKQEPDSRGIKGRIYEFGHHRTESECKIL